MHCDSRKPSASRKSLVFWPHPHLGMDPSLKLAGGQILEEGTLGHVPRHSAGIAQAQKQESARTLRKKMLGAIKERGGPRSLHLLLPNKERPKRWICLEVDK